MKRILAAVLMCGAGSCIAADAAAVKKPVPVSAAVAKAKAASSATALAAMAPADEYFGPLKLSIIGISNTIRDVGLRYTYNHDIAPQSLASARLTEGAVRDWMRRYPRDPQLPRNVYFLQRLYTKILLQESRDRAAAVAKLLFANFPSSPQARQLKKTLAIEHLSPLSSPSPVPDSFASATPAAAPAIPAAPAPGAPTPGASASAGSSVPTASPVTTAAPAPSATPAPAASASSMPARSTPAAASPLPAPATAVPTLRPVPIPMTTSAAPSASPVPAVSATPH